MGFLALASLIAAISGLHALASDKNTPIITASDNVALGALAAGFYQFNNLEIFKNPVVDEPPAAIEVIQKNDKSCVVYGNGKNDQLLPCVFSGDQNNNFVIQIEERTTLLGNNQEPALLSDFAAGEKVNVLGWLAADGKTIRAAVLRSLENKNFHQSLSGTIKNVNSGGFTLVLDNGKEISVKTPIAEGAQVTIKGVFDKVNNAVSSVLSILVKPTIIIQENQATPEVPLAPSAKPSTLFKNFLKIFGL